MRIIKEILGFIVAPLIASVVAGVLLAVLGLVQPAQAACIPDKVTITYVGAKGDPDYAKLNVGCVTVKLYVDRMKSGKSYDTDAASGGITVDSVVIIDNGSWVEIHMWFRGWRYTDDPHPVAARSTNKSASSTKVY